MDTTNVSIGVMDCKQICFNELSVMPLCSEIREVEKRVRLYVETLKVLHNQHNLKRIRYHENLVNIPLTQKLSLQDYCKMHPRDPLAILLLSTFTMPQVNEDDEPLLEKYCDTQVGVLKEGNCLNAHGFNAAYCQGTFCIGFQSEEFWANCLFLIRVNGCDEDTRWACLSHPDHVTNSTFLTWYITTLQSVNLLECNTSYQEKVCTIHLRDDHGMDILKEHAKKLLHSPYVTNVINSLPFNPRVTRYILQLKDDGVINIVLTWTDEGYGMAIQTTGRNIRETQEIARILEKEYGHK